MLGSALLDEIIATQIERELRAEDRNLLRIVQSEDRRARKARESSERETPRVPVREDPATKAWSW